MKLYVFLSILLVSIAVVHCFHMFMGTNVNKQLVHHERAKFSANMFRKRIEVFNFTIPPSYGYGRSIQGILAYDLTHSGPSANITAGGVGFNYVSLRMKSDRGKRIHYGINIYA